jgi:hypothetical protein
MIFLSVNIAFNMTLKPILRTSSTSPTTVSPKPQPALSSHLLQRLDRLGILPDPHLLQAISHYHPSQVTAALNHVEANFELIKSPKAIFLYQLPRQPIEENRPLLPVFTAKDFPGYTLQHLKSMYPFSWQSAAQHFGIPLS